MFNSRLSALSRRRTIEWWIVFILCAIPLIAAIVNIIQNFSVEPAAVAQVATIPTILSAALVWGVWALKRWAVWVMLAQGILLGGAYTLVMGAFSGVVGMVTTAIAAGLYFGALIWMYKDVLHGAYALTTTPQPPASPMPPVEPKQ